MLNDFGNWKKREKHSKLSKTLNADEGINGPSELFNSFVNPNAPAKMLQQNLVRYSQFRNNYYKLAKIYLYLYDWSFE
jgi:hypothetical protein